MEQSQNLSSSLNPLVEDSILISDAISVADQIGNRLYTGVEVWIRDLANPSVAIESRKQAASLPRPPLPRPASGSWSSISSISTPICMPCFNS